MNVFYDYYAYENLYPFWRGSGFQLDRGRYVNSLPFNFENGATLTITGCSNNSSEAEPTDVFIRFENNPYPNNEPSYETGIISFTGDIITHVINIPKLDNDEKFNSVLMYLTSENTGLIIKDISLKYFKEDLEFSKKLVFSEAFGQVTLYEPFYFKDLKWKYEFKFSKDFSRIEGGYLRILSESDDPRKVSFDNELYYSKY